MAEPYFFTIPLTLAFLYFTWYSFWGWLIETAYCSIREKHFVVRGFLAGPLCPIYGAGALIMVLFFQPLSAYPLLLYPVACVVMTSWEYLVGWALEAITHIKYWDYSDRKWNLHGRVCLSIGLCWGAVAYVAIYWIHPATESLFSLLVPPARWYAAIFLALITIADTVTTIRKLALTTKFFAMAELTWNELQQKRQDLRKSGRQAADTARLQAALAAMEIRHSNLVRAAAYHSRRFRSRFRNISTDRYKDTLVRIREQASHIREGLKIHSKKGGK